MTWNDRLAERKGCKIVRLEKTRDEQVGYELVPSEPHHFFAHVGEGVHEIPCYNMQAVAEELRDVDVQPCPVDCECRDEEE